MTGSIIVPLDGSELAERALPFAVGLAKRLDAPIHLLSALPPASQTRRLNPWTLRRSQ